MTVAPAASAAASGTPEWLTRVNLYRASAALPSVTENGTYSAGDAAHSQYMVMNQTIGHSEDPSKPYYSAAGNAAGEQSDVMVDYTTATSDSAAVDLWMTGIFHAIGILDPALSQAGYGAYRVQQSGEQMGASLNVIAGRVAPPASTAYPIVWPANGASVPLTTYTGSEFPNPLTSCPGYSAATGIPVIFQFGSRQPSVTSFTILENGAPVAACELDGTNYYNPDASSQTEGRAVLAARGAGAIIPRNPLHAGATYQVGLTSGGTTYTWSFTANPSAPPTAGRALSAGSSGSTGSTAPTRHYTPPAPRRQAPAAPAAQPAPATAATTPQPTQPAPAADPTPAPSDTPSDTPVFKTPYRPAAGELPPPAHHGDAGWLPWLAGIGALVDAFLLEFVMKLRNRLQARS